MNAHFATTTLKQFRSYQLSTILAAFFVIGVLTAGFTIVSGRAEGLGFHEPTSVPGPQNQGPRGNSLGVSSASRFLSAPVPALLCVNPGGTGGCFASIQAAVNAAANGDTINVQPGTYDEDVSIPVDNLSLLGAGAGVTNIRGIIGGSGATVQIMANNVTVAGFTITRLGNNTTDWNNPGLNTVGIAIQGQSITNALIRDNIFTGNRTGIDINHSNGHTVRNNIIDFNRTGMIFRNQTDQMTVVENFITNNWTVGILFLDGSGAGVPPQSALQSFFSNNNLSANWYGQIVDRQSGGTLPAPGTTNLKNFGGNWFGTTSPVVTTANSAEPGYAAQIPVAYGGTATPPGGQPDIAGPASANFKFTPFLLSGTDTNIETTPGRGTNGFQGVAVTITPAASPTAVDNDYTRINDAIQTAFPGETIKLVGTFDWTEANAAASWALGSDGVAATVDDYSILVPVNLHNVKFTADNLGDAAIQGPGDLAAINLEGVLVFDGGDNQNWTISNIRFFDFDLSIGMFNGAGGSDAFNNTQITNNYIRIARDLNTVVAPADTNQNIGIHYSFGMNQVISGNTIEIQGDAVSAGSTFASDVGMQSNTSGGNIYDGLQITNNIIRVLNAQDATNPQVILGIWENASAHTSNITVSGNQFINQAAGNNPAINLQRGFRVTSHSSATTTVTYQNNTVMGANIGFQWLAGSLFSGNQPVVLKSNTITGNSTGVLVQSQGLANLSFNRIVGNTVTGLNNVDGTVTAENNWWGCNAGPGMAGCDTVTGTADSNPWLVLGVSASPNPIPSGGNSTITADMTRNSDALVPVGTLPNMPVVWSATNGTMAPPTGTVTAGTATSTFTSTNTSNGTACATVDNQLTCVTVGLNTVTITPAGGGATPTDNDYTRINNAVQSALAGQTIKLVGTFDWTEANAAASWALGSDGVAATVDDYSILVPVNLHNVKFTADNLGDATIQGPGDLAAINLEGVLVFDGGDNQNWTISNIRFFDFDLSIGMFNGAGGSDAFNNTQITNNYIRIARDLNVVVAPADTNQNIGIHYSFGMNQVISGNTIEIQGDAVSAGSTFASDVGMQSNTSGGNIYDGLQITNNIIRVLNAQDATNPQVILGIWENASAHTSNITVSGNQFINQAAGNNPAINLQRGFRVTSHSSATTTVTYQNNTVMGANIGFQWLAGSLFSGNQPVVLKSNTITGNATGVLVQSQGSANLSFNRIVGNTVTGLNNVDGTVTSENNWWGCNAGPGMAGCDSVTGAADSNPWLVLGVSASPNPISPFGNSTVTADLTDNSDAADTSGSGTLPPTPVAFSATQGTMAPPNGTTTAGQASSTFTSNSSSSGTGCATVDNQPICTNITVVTLPIVSGTKTKSGGNAPGATITYTVVLSNAGGTAQLDNPGNEFTDTLPASLTLVSANATSGTTGTVANTVNWSGGIPAGGSVTITIMATINSVPDGTVVSNQGMINYDADNNGTNEATGVTDDPSVGGASDPTVFTVSDVNDPPVAVDDALSSVAEDSGQRIIPIATLLANDSAGPSNESGQTLTLTEVGNPVGGTVSKDATNVYFTPAADFNGAASFEYTITDNGTTGGSPDPKTDTANVSFTVTGGNDAPTAVNDTLPDIPENSGPRLILASTLTANDLKGGPDENGQTLTLKTVSNPEGGTVAIVNGDVVFTPMANYHGPAIFSYTIEDNGTTNGSPDPKTSGPAVVQFNITAISGSGGVLRFSSGNYSVAEGAGFRTITVERSGDTSQAVTVDYATTDHSNPADSVPCTAPGAGFASSRCDFTTAIGTLKFAAGETSKTFNVLITNDNYVEGTETLELTLSNPTNGAVFGVPQTAILSITDDASEPATNPIDNSAEFVRQQYHDILNREPDAAGLAFWTDNIEKCNDPSRIPPGQTVPQCIDKQRETTAIAFFMSPEFQMTGGFVYHLYKGSLTGAPNYDGGSAGRFPTFLEFMKDMSQVSEGIVVGGAISGPVVEANRNALAAAFALRPEFVAKYGGLNNTLYVEELFNTTGIAASAADKQALVDGLTGGTETRASVLRKVVDGTVVISESNVQFTTTYGESFINQENNRLFVFLEYIGYLRRNPDTAGFVFWLGKLNFFGGDPVQAEMVRAFILSPEYRNRFGQP